MPGKRENLDPMPNEDDDPDATAEEITSLEEEMDEEELFYALAALEAEEDQMLLPREAFVLYTEVTNVDPNTGEIREGTLVVHNDRVSEALYVLCFESLDAATDMQREFENATDEEAMVRRIAVLGNLEEYFRIRFYHANGVMEDLTQNQYRERCL
jgi:hypothetical protein